MEITGSEIRFRECVVLRVARYLLAIIVWGLVRQLVVRNGDVKPYVVRNHRGSASNFVVKIEHRTLLGIVWDLVWHPTLSSVSFGQISYLS